MRNGKGVEFRILRERNVKGVLWKGRVKNLKKKKWKGSGRESES